MQVIAKGRASQRTCPWARIALAALAAAAALAACGGDSAPSDDAAGGGKIVTALPAGAEVQLDPAYAFRGAGIEPWRAGEHMSLVYTPLFSYRHVEADDGAELIPGLAEDLPEVSENGRTYTLVLRRDLAYSDGTPVAASDFEHAVKRLLRAKTRAAALYLGVEGVDAYLESGDPRADIAGIAVDDETGAIEIRLTAPDPAFTDVLAMWFSGLVPADTPFRDLSEDPPPGVGPYSFADVGANRFRLEKNAGFADLDLPDIPTGNPQTIVVRRAGRGERPVEQALDGEIDYTQSLVPVTARASVAKRVGERYEGHRAPATDYVFMDASLPPFDDPKVREAVGRGLDRAGLAAASGAAPGCSLLPPGVRGYDAGFDTLECPYGNPTEPPDLGRARELVREAGARGARVIVARAGPGAPGVPRLYAKSLMAIGLDAVVEGEVRGRVRRPQTGVASAHEDLPHPERIYRAAVPRAAIDDEKVGSRAAALVREPRLDEVADEWAELTELAVSPPRSHLLPYGHPTITTLFSERIDPGVARFHPVYFNDHSFFALRRDEEDG